MSQVLNDAAEVLESALRNEQEAHDILIHAREAVDNPLARATFDFLAGEELKHMQAIKQFAESLARHEEFDADDLERLTSAEARSHIILIFERFRTSFEAVGASDQPRLEIYEVAMDMERRGHDFYASAARRAADEDARKLYEFLAAEEVKHFEIIQDTHDFLRQPDALLAIEERWMQI